MDKQTDRRFSGAVGRTISQIIQAHGDIREIVYFFDDTLRFKVTARKYKFKRKPTVSELLFTLGKPNYRERLLLKRDHPKFPFSSVK